MSRGTHAQCAHTFSRQQERTLRELFWIVWVL